MERGRGREAGRQEAGHRCGRDAGREGAEAVEAGQARERGHGRPVHRERVDRLCGRQRRRGGRGQARVAQHHEVDLRARTRFARREEHLQNEDQRVMYLI